MRWNWRVKGKGSIGFVTSTGKAQAQSIQKLEPQATLAAVPVGPDQRQLGHSYRYPAERFRWPWKRFPSDEFHFYDFRRLITQQLYTNSGAKS